MSASDPKGIGGGGDRQFDKCFRLTVVDETVSTCVTLEARRPQVRVPARHALPEFVALMARGDRHCARQSHRLATDLTLHRRLRRLTGRCHGPSPGPYPLTRRCHGAFSYTLTPSWCVNGPGSVEFLGGQVGLTRRTRNRTGVTRIVFQVFLADGEPP
jgi:hypothetical protein